MPPENRPFTTLGQIIATGGTLKLGSYLQSHPTEREAIEFLTNKYGSVDYTTARQAILVAERGLAFAKVINDQLAPAFELRSQPEFQDWLDAEIQRSTMFGKLAPEALAAHSRNIDRLTRPGSVFDEMPTVPGIMGENPEGLRGALYMEGWLEDATERFRMNMLLEGDESWADIVQKAQDWANKIRNYYPDRFKGIGKQRQFRIAVRAVTGSKTF